LLLTFTNSLYKIILYQMSLLHTFTSNMWFVFYSFDIFFYRIKVFSSSGKRIISFFFFLLILPFVLYLKHHSKFREIQTFSMLSPKNFVIWISLLDLWFIWSYVLESITSVSRFMFSDTWMSSYSGSICFSDSFLHCIVFSPLSKTNWLYLCDSISEIL
jgi:hypothetical protein